MTELRDLLGLKRPRGVDHSTGVGDTGGEDIKASGAGETSPEEVGLLKETQGIRGIVEDGEELGTGSLCTMHIELYTRGTKAWCTGHRWEVDGVVHRTARAEMGMEKR